ncbi:hypothetical protein [Neobacillus jeddahensis]|uniref:hypothetical protein n=1 Tax=Neobacillus jeddahensis TaxID=1461580 RepID=UPI00059141A5|nr:hypothetical protein [Neobacillus jeddahensis]
MILQHKSTVKAAIRKDGHWIGFLSANLAHPAQVTSQWYLGMKVTFTSLEELERAVAEFAYYNCNSELGKWVSFYKKS